MVLNKATSSSTHFLKLLHKKPSFFPPFTSHSFHSFPVPGLDFLPGFDEESEKNPFQTAGPKGVYGTAVIEGYLCMRVDMPGVGKEDVNVWLENSSVYFSGKEHKESDHEDGRSYFGSAVLMPGRHKSEGIQVEAKNGVVRIAVPVLPIQELKDVVRIKVKVD